MKNKGLFSSIFIDEIREEVELDDNGRGRMATLAQKWQTKDDSSTEKLWNTFLKQAVSYLQFIPPVEPSSPDIYLLKEDYNSGDPVAVLYFVAPQADFDDLSVGRFWPGKLVAELKNRSLNWGILTNGAKWCLYSLKTAKPYEDFVELDLLSALKESDEKEYGPFERFFHRNSFVKVEAEAEELESENHSEIENDENGRVEIAVVYNADSIVTQSDPKKSLRN